IKNLNSFRFLQDAVEYEIERQIDVLQSGGRVAQETRLWDTGTGSTVSMRSKEEAHDYRYFPEPDLPPLVVDGARIQAIAGSIPELRAIRRSRLVAEVGLSMKDAVQLTGGKGAYFDEMVAAGAPPKPAANLVMSVVSSTMNELKTDDVSRIIESVPARQ